MKQHVLTLSLLFIWPLVEAVPKNQECEAVTIFDPKIAAPENDNPHHRHPIIRLMDGTPKVDLYKMHRLLRNISQLQDGDKEGKGVLTFEGKKITLRHLVQLEEEKNLSAPNTLSDALLIFKKFSDAYLKEARGFKPQMTAIIHQWAHQKGRMNSILIQWSNQPEGKEHEHFKQLITSFKDLDVFLADLSCFLKSMRISCIESLKKFNEELEKFKNNRMTHKEEL